MSVMVIFCISGYIPQGCVLNSSLVVQTTGPRIIPGSPGSCCDPSVAGRLPVTRRLERRGRTCTIEEPPLVTSSRRFEGRRPFAIVLGWLEIHALYHLGVPPGLLARRYEAQRRRARKSLSLLREADG